MYEELIDTLRLCESNTHCKECPYYNRNKQTEECKKLLVCAADAIEELSKRLDESIPKGDAEIIIAEVAKPRWIPVTERLPEAGAPVLVVYIGYNSGTTRSDMIAVYDGYTWCYWDDGYGDECAVKITHWMPLPELPKEET